MRFSATVLLVACCAASLVGCCGRHHRHGCLFGDRYKHKHCVDRDEWDECDQDDFDHDDRGGCDCGCHPYAGYGMPDYGVPMQSFDSGCGCGGGMPSYGGMPMSFDSFPQSSGCSSCGGGMSMPSYPTFDQPVMMSAPTPVPTPAPATTTPPPAPAAESYYSPKGLTPTPDQASTAPQRF